ncbi:ROK family protein [Yoonia sp. 208BN28-4]|uniref:ROK family protein n=1 Tax=Yoonia sp. 208BN28-4 TaxID=3126505 RepID=UPI0030A757A7
MYDVTETKQVTAQDGCGPMLPALETDTRPLRQQVFEHVRAAGRAARADVTRALAISAGSATTITADLIAAGLLQEVEDAPRESGRGRPPVALEVVPEARYVIGIKLSDGKHSIMLADFAGHAVAEATLGSSVNRKTTAELMDEIALLLDAVLANAKMEAHQISAVGIGVSGIADYQTGVVAWSPMLLERDVDLAAAFQDRFGIPAHIDNDANVLTLAELWFGTGRTMKDFAVVTIENGVGMGLVLNNRLYRGSRGMGLELGHTKVHLDGALCRCGQRGCLEAYLADYALAREAATALNHLANADIAPQSMLETLYAQAKSGNLPARTIFKRAARYLSVGLSNVVQLFDPDLIILSGERMRYDYLYAEDMLAEMQSLTLSEGRAPCRVEIHGWDNLVWARGATALALSALTDTVLGDAR